MTPMKNMLDHQLGKRQIMIKPGPRERGNMKRRMRNKVWLLRKQEKIVQKHFNLEISAHCAMRGNFYSRGTKQNLIIWV